MPSECNLAGSLKLDDDLNEWNMEFAPPWWRNEIWVQETIFDSWQGQEIWFNIPVMDRMQIESKMKIAWILETGHYYRTWNNFENDIRNGQDCYDYLSSTIANVQYENSLGFRNPNIKNKIRDFGIKPFNKNLLIAIGLGIAIS